MGNRRSPSHRAKIARKRERCHSSMPTMVYVRNGLDDVLDDLVAAFVEWWKDSASIGDAVAMLERRRVEFQGDSEGFA